MSTKEAASASTAPTQFLQTAGESYAYRRFGSGSKPALLCLHFTGTLDNWDPAVESGGWRGVHRKAHAALARSRAHLGAGGGTSTNCSLSGVGAGVG